MSHLERHRATVLAAIARALRLAAAASGLAAAAHAAWHVTASVLGLGCP